MILFRRPFYKLMKLRRGYSMQIFPTFKCNYNCGYCINKGGGTTMPQSTEMTANEWKRFIREFSAKLKHISIGSGEPTLYHDFLPLVSWLLKQGYLCSIYTNLSNVNTLNKLPRTPRLLIYATFHPTQTDDTKFIERLNKLHHHYELHELGEQRIKGSVLLPYLKEPEDVIMKGMFRVTPDGMVFLNCLDILKKYL